MGFLLRDGPANGQVLRGSAAGDTMLWDPVSQSWVIGAPAGGGGSSPYPTGPNYFIFPLTGSDTNDGLTAATALKTAEEWTRRLNGQVLTAALTTVTCGAGTVGAFGVNVGGMHIRSQAGAKLLFQGATPLQSVSGTITAVLTASAASGQEDSFTAVGGPALVDKQRLRIIAGTPANIGAVAYIKGFAGGDPTKPITSQWFTCPSSDPAVKVVPINPVNGDTFVVETLQTAVTGFNMYWEGIGGGGGTGFPCLRDMSQQQAATRGTWQFVTTEKSSENNGHALLQRCTFNVSVTDDFTASSWWFQGVDLQNPIILSQKGTFYGFECCMIRERITQDTCGMIWIARNCIDSANGIGHSCGPGSIIISDTNADVCTSRSNGQGLVIIPGATYIGSGVILWAPPVGARNGLTDGVAIRPGGYMSLSSGAFQVNFFRSSSGNPLLVADVAQSFPIWDAMHGCGCVWENGFSGGPFFFRDTESTSLPTGNGVSGSRIYGQTGAIHGRGLGGSIRTLLGAGAAAAGHKSYDGVRVPGGPVNTVNAVTSTIATFDCAAPPEGAAIGTAGLMLKGYAVGRNGTLVVSTEISQSASVIAGVVALNGAKTTVVAPQGDAALAGIVLNFVQSGTTILLQVTGVAANTISWNGTLEVRSGDFAG